MGKKKAKFAIGALGKAIKLENFGGVKIVKFIIGEIIINAIGWGVLAPVFDIVLYKEPANKVFLQGSFAAVSNSLTVAILGSILILAFSKTIVKKGSLREE